MNDQLIVALDVPTIKQARDLINQLDGTISFFKIGMWLVYADGCEELIKDLIKSNKKVFLDTKMYDIGKTVEEGVKRIVDRGIDIITVHGDSKIIESAVKGRGDSKLKVFAISVLTSLNDDSLKEMGYALTTKELVKFRAKQAVELGCDGLIASAADNPDKIRLESGNSMLLIGTPGIRSIDDPVDDHARSATAIEAIATGSDYLIVGRPIISHANPLDRAKKILFEMNDGLKLRYNS